MKEKMKKWEMGRDSRYFCLGGEKSCSITDGSTRHILPDKYEQTQRNLLSSQQRMASNHRRSLGCMFEGMGSA
jgi:hypothetical protein